MNAYSNDELPQCDETDVCIVTNGEPFELMDENIVASQVFLRTIRLSPPQQIRVKGSKDGDIMFQTLPTITMLDTVLDNYDTVNPLTLQDRDDIIRKCTIMYEQMTSHRFRS